VEGPALLKLVARVIHLPTGVLSLAPFACQADRADPGCSPSSPGASWCRLLAAGSRGVGPSEIGPWGSRKVPGITPSVNVDRPGRPGGWSSVRCVGRPSRNAPYGTLCPSHGRHTGVPSGICALLCEGSCEVAELPRGQVSRRTGESSRRARDACARIHVQPSGDLQA
jgi:hypothetical protein